MESYKEFTVGCAYIGETQYKAGIFLSQRIAENKPYGKHLVLKKFENFNAAETVFFEKYGEVVQKEEFRLNRLFQVRESPLYSVYWTSFCAGVTYTKNFYENMGVILPGHNSFLGVKHDMEYQDAMCYAISIIESHRKFSKKGIITRIRLHMPVYYYD